MWNAVSGLIQGPSNRPPNSQKQVTQIHVHVNTQQRQSYKPPQKKPSATNNYQQNGNFQPRTENRLQNANYKKGPQRSNGVPNNTNNFQKPSNQAQRPRGNNSNQNSQSDNKKTIIVKKTIIIKKS